jgi:hypothetical protein
MKSQTFLPTPALVIAIFTYSDSLFGIASDGQIFTLDFAK